MVIVCSCRRPVENGHVTSDRRSLAGSRRRRSRQRDLLLWPPSRIYHFLYFFFSGKMSGESPIHASVSVSSSTECHPHDDDQPGVPWSKQSSNQRINPPSRAVSIRGRGQIPRPSRSLIPSSSRRGLLRTSMRTQEVDPGCASSINHAEAAVLWRPCFRQTRSRSRVFVSICS